MTYPPDEQRGISVSNVYVRPDAAQLASLAALLDKGMLSPWPVTTYAIEEAGAALASVIDGTARGTAVVEFKTGR